MLSAGLKTIYFILFLRKWQKKWNSSSMFSNLLGIGKKYQFKVKMYSKLPIILKGFSIYISYFLFGQFSCIQGCSSGCNRHWTNSLIQHWWIVHAPPGWSRGCLNTFIFLIILNLGSVRFFSRFFKGQLISECLSYSLKFPKNPTKNFTNFCPRV